MKALYNEIEPFACAWLSNLMDAGLITPGKIDDRSIVDLQPDDLAGYERVHFFAGIGGWDYALQLAGWDGPVWTGSCPCQPFSAAGQQRGSDDERHLWPAFFRLIRECRPSIVFGEQVAGAAGLAWLDHVCADLEGAGYAAAAANLCAAGVGAPHIRQRLYWVADSRGEGRRQVGADIGRGDEGSRPQGMVERPMHGGAVRVADSSSTGLEGRYARTLGDEFRAAQRGGEDGVVGNAEILGRARLRREPEHEGAGLASPWADLEWLPCRDGKARPTQPSIFPLAHGIPNRVGTLRGAGNAIVPQVASEFVAALMECRP